MQKIPNFFARVIIAVALVTMASSVAGCRPSVYPAYSVVVQNNSDKTVLIFSRFFTEGEWGEVRNWGQINPGETRVAFSMGDPTPKSSEEKYWVQARELDAKIVRSWDFPFQKRVLLVIDQTDIPK